MATPGPPEPAPVELRASDAERGAVVRRLQTAFAEGRLTVDEFTERSAAADASRSHAELVALTRDLPVPEDAQAPAAGPPVARPEGVELDYRGAALGSETLELRALALVGGVEVLVPDDVHVELTGFALFGGVAVQARPRP